MPRPIVAIVGRPNVGKSTLFNLIANKKISIVEDNPGVTRDRLYAPAQWLDKDFMLVDTGGIESDSKDEMFAHIRAQAEIAIKEADVIVFLVDARDGLLQQDEAVCAILRSAKKSVILAVNKTDSPKQEALVYDFYSLGLGDPIPISSANKLNIGDLLDAIVAKFPAEESGEDERDEDVIRVAIIGRPNVGKSSIFNALVGSERSIVSDVAGTTRDAIDTTVQRNGMKFLFIDTAGMRKKSKVDEPVEKYSVIRSLRSVDRADVTLMVLDAAEGVTEQDKKIAGYAHDEGKGVVIVVNKWDLTVKDTSTHLRYTENLRKEIIFLQYAPIVYVSAKNNQRIGRLPELIHYVAEQHSMRVATGVLNQVIGDAVSTNPPPSERGVKLKILYATQVKTKPPTFVFFVNDPAIMHFSYQRFLENKLRDAFGFEGTPIHIIIRGRDENK
ncbi:MAG: ribosome biogenesis GTPase Der [Acidaminococcales bacterium]|nr:ribosome biogenesis GTPase Der [Acidaminococcales bacterium]